MNTKPIGIFDSGLGGISVWKEVIKLLPNEHTIYYADSDNCPYGPRSIEDIRQLSERIVQFLLHKKCKIIVIACNTITAAAIDYLRTTYREVSFIGIEPAIKPAAENTKTGSIGIFATKSTLESELFNTTKKKYAENIQVATQVGEGWVKMVEENRINTTASRVLIEENIQLMLDLNVDQIVLGCTHYPFLLPIVEAITGGKVNIINPAPAVAGRTKEVLQQHELLNKNDFKGKYHFYTSGDKRILADFLAIHTQEKGIIHQD